MPWAAAAAVTSAVIGANASQDAANTQAGASRDATQAQLNMFNQTQQNMQPYMQAGVSSLDRLMQGVQSGAYNQNTNFQQVSPYQNYGMAQFNASPEAQLLAQTNQSTLNKAMNAASISGGMNSNNIMGLTGATQANTLGAYGNALQNYLAQTQQGNAGIAQNNQALQMGNSALQTNYANLANLASQGQNAAAGLGGIATNVGQSVANNIIGAGNAQAAGTMGTANAITGGLSSGYNNWLQQQYMGGSGSNNVYQAADGLANWMGL